jgi:2,5-furandicarboxylate decarboxylase 1
MVTNNKWTRLGVDATVPLPKPAKFKRATMAEVNLSRFEFEGF